MHVAMQYALLVHVKFNETLYEYTEPCVSLTQSLADSRAVALMEVAERRRAQSARREEKYIIIFQNKFVFKKYLKDFANVCYFLLKKY